jgi:hypothetical protein
MTGKMWQPIKTAPKDGRPVLLWPYYPKDDAFDDLTKASGNVTVAMWVRRERGQKAHWFNWFDDGYEDFSPTHWTPLPDAPETTP